MSENNKPGNGLNGNFDMATMNVDHYELMTQLTQ